MNQLNVQKLTHWHTLHKEKSVYGRRIIFEMILPILKTLPDAFKVVQVGQSFNKIPIYKVSIGQGRIKVLLWSQMHGNESTGTKAMFDLFNLFINPGENTNVIKEILNKCTLVFIPMLNPDGALTYTRVNAQDIDLNRDAVDLEAPESSILHRVLKEVNPSFCFNIHDQRTIFSVGRQNLPATLSFLAPSVDENRTLTDGRKVTMSVIASIYEELSKLIPGQIGRYTDEFYPKATGDNFEKAGHHTILVESGHFKDDYDREEVRKYTFIAFVVGLFTIVSDEKFDNHQQYFDIPNNKKKYLDIIYKNVFLTDLDKKTDIGIIFKEKLEDQQVLFLPHIEEIKDLSGYNANKIIDLNGKVFLNKEDFSYK
ncbi:MAG: M14 family zinc carboxypeptidase [Flavobacteriaceae bacterium]|nr:M14 family zinc carboxypeptidase [Flavobacteriaceae bacterium]